MSIAQSKPFTDVCQHKNVREEDVVVAENPSGSCELNFENTLLAIVVNRDGFVEIEMTNSCPWLRLSCFQDGRIRVFSAGETTV
jgi:hypothetical protein